MQNESAYAAGNTTKSLQPKSSILCNRKGDIFEELDIHIAFEIRNLSSERSVEVTAAVAGIANSSYYCRKAHALDDLKAQFRDRLSVYTLDMLDTAGKYLMPTK
jgi:hypothetical protein